MIASPSGAFAGVGFAIPSDTVNRIVQCFGWQNPGVCCWRWLKVAESYWLVTFGLAKGPFQDFVWLFKPSYKGIEQAGFDDSGMLDLMCKKHVQAQKNASSIQLLAHLARYEQTEAGVFWALSGVHAPGSFERLFVKSWWQAGFYHVIFHCPCLSPCYGCWLGLVERSWLLLEVFDRCWVGVEALHFWCESWALTCKNRCNHSVNMCERSMAYISCHLVCCMLASHICFVWFSCSCTLKLYTVASLQQTTKKNKNTWPQVYIKGTKVLFLASLLCLWGRLSSMAMPNTPIWGSTSPWISGRRRSPACWSARAWAESRASWWPDAIDESLHERTQLATVSFCLFFLKGLGYVSW